MGERWLFERISSSALRHISSSKYWVLFQRCNVGQHVIDLFGESAVIFLSLLERFEPAANVGEALAQRREVFVRFLPERKGVQTW